MVALCSFLFLQMNLHLIKITFKLSKYADDMALAGLLQKNDSSGEASYFAYTKALETRCVASQLEISVSKTNELVICTKPNQTEEPVSIEGQLLETVETLKYLGTILDRHLSFAENTNFVF